MPQHDQPAAQLVSTPRVLCPQAKHGRLGLKRCSLRRLPRPPRAISKSYNAILRIPFKPLVSSLTTDSKAPAYLCNICIRLHCQSHKFIAQRHGRYLCHGMTDLLLDNHHAAQRRYLCPCTCYLSLLSTVCTSLDIDLTRLVCRCGPGESARIFHGSLTSLRRHSDNPHETVRDALH